VAGPIVRPAAGRRCCLRRDRFRARCNDIRTAHRTADAWSCRWRAGASAIQRGDDASW